MFQAQVLVKKTHFDERWVINFFSGKNLSRSNQSLDKQTLIFHMTEVCIQYPM